jgi:hypothetical protein
MFGHDILLPMKQERLPNFGSAVALLAVIVFLWLFRLCRLFYALANHGEAIGDHHE